MVGEILIAMMMATTPIATDEGVPYDYTSEAQVVVAEETQTIRVTEYCPACNCPAGHGSATGKYLEEGDCACGWLPMGTEVVIDGRTYTVVDVCGTDAVDLFVDDGSGVCHCDKNEYVEAAIRLP